MKPTDEQVAILDAIKTTGDNLLIEACPGSGKSTTLEMIQAEHAGPALYVAFGVMDAKGFGMEKDEFGVPTKKPKPTLKLSTKAQTLNSLGHGVWAKVVPKIVLDKNKTYKIITAVFDELKGGDKQNAWDQYSEIKEAVSMARHLGYIPAGAERLAPYARPLCDRAGLEARLENKLTPLAWSIVDSALKTSITAAYTGLIDFDDQIYMSALFGGTFPRFPLVLIDEDQDLDPANHAMLGKLCKESRVVAVGDRWQSIYYFRGAETGGADKIKTKFNMVEYPLSVNFRCPRAIVEAARWRCPNMKWIKDGGKYEVLSDLDAATIPEGAAIICRNNAPLLKAAFALLSGKRSVQVVGSDISGKIVKLLKRIGAPTDNRETLLLKIDAWRDEKLQTSNAPATTMDTAECLKVFASWGSNTEQAVSYAEHIFKQQGTITLTTGHKAKGKEWDVVYFLDQHLLSKEDQDLNLRYVIQTRSKDTAYEITTESTTWQ
jgi:superfamily I DNA/RNA helicase